MANDVKTPAGENVPIGYVPRAPGAANWGEVYPNYATTGRYIPGGGSPWGNPDVAGGNKEFYRAQLANLLRGEQTFRARQAYAAEGARNAEAKPFTPPTRAEMWSWANNGKGVQDRSLKGKYFPAPTAAAETAPAPAPDYRTPQQQLMGSDAVKKVEMSLMPRSIFFPPRRF